MAETKGLDLEEIRARTIRDRREMGRIAEFRPETIRTRFRDAAMDRAILLAEVERLRDYASPTP